MRKHVVLLGALLIVLIVTLVSCNAYANYAVTRGKVIDVYPEWCCVYSYWGGIKGPTTGGEANSFGYSEWIDWQGDDGQLLHDLVDDDIVSDNFLGKYRIESSGQELMICFNDAKSSHADFFQYIGGYTKYHDDRLVKIDTDSDAVEYDCWLRKASGSIRFNDYGFVDACNDSNRANVVMTKIDGRSYRFVLTVAGEKTMDVVLKNCLNEPGKAVLPKDYSKYPWFPFGFDEVVGTDYWSNGYYGENWLLFSADGNAVDIGPTSGNTTFCFEGVSLRSIDEDEKRVSFWLEDRAQSGFADYFEVHIIDDSWTDCPERGATEKNKFMKGTLGFYKEGDPVPVRFYDEDHSQFSKH